VHPDNSRTSILSITFDTANVITISGLAFAVIGIYCVGMHRPEYGLAFALWGVMLDWLDGYVARRISHRSEMIKAAGRELDSLADLVTSAVVPGLAFLEAGGYRAIFLPGAMLLILAGAVRLAHYNVSGLSDGYFRGLPIIFNGAVIGLVFLAKPWIGEAAFPSLLYFIVIAVGMANVGPFWFPKFPGAAYYVFPIIVLSISIALLLSG
jgi:CDP-diacylglycerol---serine O-phosphatidyltransferase